MWRESARLGSSLSNVPLFRIPETFSISADKVITLKYYIIIDTPIRVSGDVRAFAYKHVR